MKFVTLDQLRHNNRNLVHKVLNFAWRFVFLFAMAAICLFSCTNESDDDVMTSKNNTPFGYSLYVEPMANVDNNGKMTSVKFRSKNWERHPISCTISVYAEFMENYKPCGTSIIVQNVVFPPNNPSEQHVDFTDIIAGEYEISQLYSEHEEADFKDFMKYRDGNLIFDGCKKIECTNDEQCGSYGLYCDDGECERPSCSPKDAEGQRRIGRHSCSEWSVCEGFGRDAECVRKEFKPIVEIFSTGYYGGDFHGYAFDPDVPHETLNVDLYFARERGQKREEWIYVDTILADRPYAKVNANSEKSVAYLEKHYPGHHAFSSHISKLSCPQSCDVGKSYYLHAVVYDNKFTSHEVVERNYAVRFKCYGPGHDNYRPIINLDSFGQDGIFRGWVVDPDWPNRKEDIFFYIKGEGIPPNCPFNIYCLPWTGSLRADLPPADDNRDYWGLGENYDFELDLTKISVTEYLKPNIEYELYIFTLYPNLSEKESVLLQNRARDEQIKKRHGPIKFTLSPDDSPY